MRLFSYALLHSRGIWSVALVALGDWSIREVLDRPTSPEERSPEVKVSAP